MTPIRVFIIEDCRVTQQLLSHVLSADPGIKVVGVAAAAEEALAALPAAKPDVVTMDVHLPRMDGFEATRRIMETHPVPVVIVTATWRPGDVATTFKALEAGAVAAVGTPRGPGHPSHAEDVQRLVRTVRAMSEVKVVRRWSRDRHPPPPPPTPAAHVAKPVPPVAHAAAPAAPAGLVTLVAIGASTGGPQALQAVLARLPVPFPVPVLIVQHIAAGFLGGLADWLSASTALTVRVAVDGEVAAPGRAYLAPDGSHMGVRTGGRIVLSPGGADDPIRPSVSHLFASVAKSYGPAAAGVLLTGMGRDGADGLLLLRRAGALTVAQDRESSVVFGMPAEAVRLGAAAYVLGLEGIAGLLALAVRAGAGGGRGARDGDVDDRSDRNANGRGKAP